MARRNTRIPAQPAPKALKAKVEAYVKARTAGAVAQAALDKRRDRWAGQLAGATEAVLAAESYRDMLIEQQASDTIEESETVAITNGVIENAHAELVEVAREVRTDDAKVFMATVDGHDWIIETKSSPPVLEIGADGLNDDAALRHLQEHIGLVWAGMMDVVMPRKPALGKLKQLVQFAEKQGQPIPYVTLESRDINVIVREPDREE